MEGITTSDTKDTSTPCLSPSIAAAPASAAAATLPKPQPSPQSSLASQGLVSPQTDTPPIKAQPPTPSNLASQGMVSPETETPQIGANATTRSPSTNINTARNNHNSASAEPPKSLRGLNKPKCSECGNVARSRCPFQACKSCCVKARNPCHIHVLKQNASYPEKGPSQSSPLLDQQRVNASSNKFSPLGSSRASPVLHHTHPYMPGSLAQRVKRPLSRKEIAAINNWRFVKLKEYSDSKIEAEDEAFGRYMQNVSLLEDVFSLPTTPLEGLSEDGNVTFESRLSGQANSVSEDYNDDMLVEGQKVQLKSNTQRSEKHRQRLRTLIEKGLQKLKRGDHGNLAEDDENNPAVIPGDCAEVKKPKAIGRERLKKVTLISTLLDKLSKARNQEDINACIEMYSHTFGKDILGSAINTNISEEIHSSQVEEGMPDAIPSENEPTPMEWVGEERRSECSGVFDGQQRQILSNPKIYIKGWTEINISEEKSQHIYENLLSMKDVAEL